MNKRSLPTVSIPNPPSGRYESQLLPKALDHWMPSIRASDSSSERSIGIYEQIGYDSWSGEGVSAQRIAAALRQLGPGPVVVNINSPGGSLYEGLAIYNMLREHDGHITVKVLGIAASAASVIAMAGDTIQVGRAAFLMVHNSWIMAIGNRHDFRNFADWLEPFDAAIADVYAARTGLDLSIVQQLMDAESFIGGSEAVERGFADELLPSDAATGGDTANASAARRLENALRASGMPKAQAMKLISEFKSGVKPGGGEGDPAATGTGDPAELAEIAALAASLTTVLEPQS